MMRVKIPKGHKWSGKCKAGDMVNMRGKMDDDETIALDHMEKGASRPKAKKVSAVSYLKSKQTGD